MSKFVPVIVADSDFFQRGDLFRRVREMSGLFYDRTLFAEAVVVTRHCDSEKAVKLAGRHSGRLTFVAVPQNCSTDFAVAAGAMIAGIANPDCPLLLMDAAVDRSSLTDFSRDIKDALKKVPGDQVLLLGNEGRFPDFACSIDTLRRAYFGAGERTYSAVCKALDSLTVESNVVSFPNWEVTPSTDFADLIHSADAVSYPFSTQQLDMYSPWQTRAAGYHAF